MEAAGARYSDCGRERDPLELFREVGFTTARLRLFHTPCGRGAQVNDLSYTVSLAKRCAAAGFDILLCPHFSDTWADPGQQATPRAWAGLGFRELCLAVQEYTHRVVRTMFDAGCGPSVVQIGNEITGGFLWDTGRVASSCASTGDNWSGVLAADAQRWDAFTALLRSAVLGVESGSRNHGSDSPSIMLHIDRGGDEEAASCFFDWMKRCRVRYDQIGLSYYPFWHGTLEDVCATVTGLHRDFGRPVHVVETAFPADSHALYSDKTEAVSAALGVPASHGVDYPISDEGQHAFVADLLDAMTRHAADGWEGLTYWAPEWIEVAGHVDEPDAETCWPRALFNRQGRARRALGAFRRFSGRSGPLVEVARGKAGARI